MEIKRITVTIAVNWLIAIAAVGLILITLYAWLSEYRDVLAFTAAVIAGMAALVAAVNAIDTRRAETEARKSMTEQSRKMASLEYIHRWTNPTFHHAKKNGRELMKEFSADKTDDEKRKYLEADSTKLGNLIDVLNVFESMSVALQEGILDEPVIKRFFRSILLQYWHCSEPFIKTRRSERNNPRIFRELEYLYNSWKD